MAALRAIQDELEQAYEKDDLERTVRLNHEFHRTINVAADSPKLTQFMSGITRYAPESVFPTVSGWPKQSIRDHRRVIAAFERRDADRARMAMAEHFTIGVAPLTDHLIERGVITRRRVAGGGRRLIAATRLQRAAARRSCTTLSPLTLRRNPRRPGPRRPRSTLSARRRELRAARRSAP